MPRCGGFQVAGAAIAASNQANDPGQDKHANDGEAERIEIAVERADALPEFSLQTELAPARLSASTLPISTATLTEMAVMTKL